MASRRLGPNPVQEAQKKAEAIFRSQRVVPRKPIGTVIEHSRGSCFCGNRQFQYRKNQEIWYCLACGLVWIVPPEEDRNLNGRTPS